MTNRKIWAVVLACWLILYGLLQISNVRFELSGFLLGALALAAAVLLLLDR